MNTHMYVQPTKKSKFHIAILSHSCNPLALHAQSPPISNTSSTFLLVLVTLDACVCLQSPGESLPLCLCPIHMQLISRHPCQNRHRAVQTSSLVTLVYVFQQNGSVNASSHPACVRVQAKYQLTRFLSSEWYNKCASKMQSLGPRPVHHF